jgi:hypothetical protein
MLHSLQSVEMLLSQIIGMILCGAVVVLSLLMEDTTIFVVGAIQKILLVFRR